VISEGMLDRMERSRDVGCFAGSYRADCIKATYEKPY